MPRRSWNPLGFVVVLGFALGCSKAPIDARLPVRGLSLHIVCRGEGRPPVVLDSGLGNDSAIWSSVLPDIARSSQVCAYDRAGMGASSRPAPRPHSNRLMAEELHELLRAAKIPEPYVLVGHSIGGANIRYLAAKSPRAVAGMVMVDSVSEHQPARFWALLPEATLSEFKQGLARMPEGIDFDTFRDGLEQLATVSPSLGNLPLVVLARGKSLPPPSGIRPEGEKQLEQSWRSMQDDLARLSGNSAYLVVENAGHHIQLDRPDVLVAAINELLASVRQGRPLNREAIAAKQN
ncbi:MAG TPA: alpha/beta fold hydrolase [Polyangiaceae bacterium]|nr:alpha/beta fold hydrolase [Polyangiaceae bacterium]